MSLMTPREQRASVIADVLAAIEVHPDDEDLRDELNKLSTWIRGRGKQTPEDDQRLIIKSVREHGGYTPEDIAFDTGLPETIVRRMLHSLILKEILAIQQFGGRKIIVMNDMTVLKVA